MLCCPYWQQVPTLLMSDPKRYPVHTLAKVLTQQQHLAQMAGTQQDPGC